MPETEAWSRTQKRTSPIERADSDAFVAAIGRLVRLSRAKHGVTRRQLAQDSGTSERYLAQIESGEGNPSVIVLRSIAEALDVPIIELLPRSNGGTAAMTVIVRVILPAKAGSHALMVHARLRSPHQECSDRTP